jgi:hypothetical protein
MSRIEPRLPLTVKDANDRNRIAKQPLLTRRSLCAEAFCEILRFPVW